MTNVGVDHAVKLDSSRSLSYLELGDPLSPPVLLFHGSPGSRLDALLVDPSDPSLASVRLIAPDRPGIGMSGPLPGRKLLDWTRDVTGLADQIGMERFAVVGISGGGPYAAACASAIGDRLTGVAIVSGLAPFEVPGITRGMGMNRYFIRLARAAPWLLERLMAPMGHLLTDDPERAMDRLMSGFCPADQEVLSSDLRLQKAFLESLREAYRQGVSPVVEDMGVCASPWGFDPRDISVPVQLWHGDLDTTAPMAMGRYLADSIPGSALHVVPGEGHLMFVNHIAEILEGLCD